MPKVKLLKTHTVWDAAYVDGYTDYVAKLAVDEYSPWTEVDDTQLQYLKDWVTAQKGTHALIMYEDPTVICKCIEDQIKEAEVKRQKEAAKVEKQRQRYAARNKLTKEKKLASAQRRLEKLKEELSKD